MSTENEKSIHATFNSLSSKILKADSHYRRGEVKSKTTYIYQDIVKRISFNLKNSTDERYALWANEVQREAENVHSFIKEIKGMSKEQLQKHLKDILNPPKVEAPKVETLTEQKTRIFNYLVEFCKTGDSAALREAIKIKDEKEFRKFVFCEITDYMGTPINLAKYKNYNKLSNPIHTAVEVKKGPSLILDEPNKGILMHASIGDNHADLNSIAYATYKQVFPDNK